MAKLTVDRIAKRVRSRKSKPIKGTDPKALNASEALFGFSGFLTSRSEPIILSRQHDASVLGQLADAYIKANGLPAIRDGWGKLLKHPEGVEHLTNLPSRSATTAAPPLPPEAALKGIIELLDRVDHEKRNWVLAKLMQDQKGRNKYSQMCARRQIKSSMDHLNTLQERSRELDLILSGNIVSL